MAPFIFTKKIINGEVIDINNNGDMWRDFTYIDDIVEGVIRVSSIIPKRNDDWTVELGSPATSSAPYRVYNIGYGSPVNLMDFIKILEDELGIEAKKNFREMQPGDVYKTYSDTQDLFNATSYKPKVGIKEGIANLVKWYREYYKI
ncbi:Vi polysaccharide biosynthesis protein TviC [Providencia stuartii]|nr:Vi polysaccharide biosynthesis protein TviC [Providencia stuartii]